MSTAEKIKQHWAANNGGWGQTSKSIEWYLRAAAMNPTGGKLWRNPDSVQDNTHRRFHSSAIQSKPSRSRRAHQLHSLTLIAAKHCNTHRHYWQLLEICCTRSIQWSKNILDLMICQDGKKWERSPFTEKIRCISNACDNWNVIFILTACYWATEDGTAIPVHHLGFVLISDNTQLEFSYACE